MKLSISTGFCYTMNNEDLFEIIADSGCSSIELLMNQVVAAMTDEEIIAAVARHNLTVRSVHAFQRAWLPTFVDEEHAAVTRALKLARHFDAQLVTSHFTPIKPQGVYVCNDDNHFETIRRFNTHGDIPVATENFPTGLPTVLCKYDELLHRLEQNTLPLTFDVTHCADSWGDIFRGYEMFRPYIRNIHLSDYMPGESRASFGRGIQHLAPGRGVLPLRAFVQHLVADGYCGLLTLEVDFASPGAGKIADNKAVADELCRAVKLVRQWI